MAYETMLLYSELLQSIDMSAVRYQTPFRPSSNEVQRNDWQIVREMAGYAKSIAWTKRFSTAAVPTSSTSERLR